MTDKKLYGAIADSDASAPPPQETKEDSAVETLPLFKKLSSRRLGWIAGVVLLVPVLFWALASSSMPSSTSSSLETLDVPIVGQVSSCPATDACTGGYSMHRFSGAVCGELCVPAAQVPARSAQGYNCGTCQAADVSLNGKSGTLTGTSGSSGSSSTTGGGQSFTNMQPYLAVNYIIALYGVYPSRTRRLTEDEHRRLQAGEPFIGEIFMFAGNFAPRGFAFCDGQLLAVSSNNALFSLLGTIYGGDGRTTFGLPDLRGRIPIGAGTGPGLSDRRLGQKFGIEKETMTTVTMPSHHHSLAISSFSPLTTTITGTDTINDNKSFNLESITGPSSVNTRSTGAGQPLDNMQPSLALNYVIAVQGTFPSRNRRLQGAHRRLDVNPFLADISIVAFNFAPRGWSFCNGAVLPINQNTALFSLLGTAFGGDGRTSFALPDLRGRTAIGVGRGPGLENFSWGQQTGAEGNYLDVQHLTSSHSHTVAASALSPLQGTLSGTGTVADATTPTFSSITGPTVTSGVVSGSNIPVDLMEPSLAINYVIALQGIYPSRSRRLEDEGLEDLEGTTDANHRRLGLDPYVGQIQLFAGNFAPRGWAFCNGALLPISSNTALFSLIGTTYGGDGRTTMALPDLRGHAAMHEGRGPGLTPRKLGERGGAAQINLGSADLAAHSHGIDAGQFSPMSFVFRSN